MIREIERDWNREPGWFWTLDRERQADVLAEHRVRQNPEGHGRLKGTDRDRVIHKGHGRRR